MHHFIAEPRAITAGTRGMPEPARTARCVSVGVRTSRVAGVFWVRIRQPWHDLAQQTP